MPSPPSTATLSLRSSPAAGAAAGAFASRKVTKRHRARAQAAAPAASAGSRPAHARRARRSRAARARSPARRRPCRRALRARGRTPSSRRRASCPRSSTSGVSLSSATAPTKVTFSKSSSVSLRDFRRRKVAAGRRRWSAIVHLAEADAGRRRAPLHAARVTGIGDEDDLHPLLVGLLHPFEHFIVENALAWCRVRRQRISRAGNSRSARPPRRDGPVGSGSCPPCPA